MTSDAAGAIGYGAIFRSASFYDAWPPAFQLDSITFKELFPIVVAAHLWGNQWSRLRVEFICDNASIVAVLNSGISRDSRVMHLIRCLTRLAGKYHFSFRASHIPGSRNVNADALSRFQLQTFHQLAPHADRLPTIIPPQVSSAWQSNADIALPNFSLRSTGSIYTSHIRRRSTQI